MLTPIPARCKVCGHPKDTDEHAGISHLPFTKAHTFQPEPEPDPEGKGMSARELKARFNL